MAAHPRENSILRVAPKSALHSAAGEIQNARIRGRGSTLNPVNRFETKAIELAPEHAEAVRLERSEAGDVALPQLATRIHADVTRSIINPVDSPDIGFKWTINPYRGCEHGCIYCYARPGHEYLGMSLGVDFETQIFAKHDAPELLRAALMKPSWKGETIVMSGVTDCYQPVERDLRITRRILEVCIEFRQSVSLITKNRLITRDLDLFARMREYDGVRAAVSLTSLDPHLSSIMEPRASSPAARLAAIRELTAAGVPVTVMTAPILPRINDHELPALLHAAAEAGAHDAGYVLLRLPYQNKQLFGDWLRTHFPDRAEHVETLIKQSHGGKLYDSAWHTRMRGEGAFADQINATFHLFAKRAGLDRKRGELNTGAFTRPALAPKVKPADARQGTLFG